MGDGGRAGALRVWEKERNEMTTGEGRAFPWFTSSAAGTAVRLGQKDRLSGRCLTTGERERGWPAVACTTKKYDKNKTKLYDSRKISEKITICISNSEKSPSPTNHLFSAVVITTSSILRYLRIANHWV